MNPLDILGINWKVFLGQCINILVLFWLLQKFAIKPFLKILKERKEKIDKGVKLSEEAEKKINLAEKEKEKILMDGEIKAKQILKQSEERGKQKEKEILNLAEKEKEKILEDAKKAAQNEIERLKKEFSQKNLDLVLALSEKILKEKIDLKKDEEIIKNLLVDK